MVAILPNLKLMSKLRPDLASVVFANDSYLGAHLVATQWHHDRKNYIPERKTLAQTYERTVEELLEYLLYLIHDQPPEAAFLELADTTALLLDVFRKADVDQGWHVYQPNSPQVRRWQEVFSKAVLELPLNGHQWEGQANILTVLNLLEQISVTMAHLGGIELDHQAFNQLVGDILNTLTDPNLITWSEFGEPKLIKSEEKRLLQKLQHIFVTAHDSSVATHLNGYLDVSKFPEFLELLQQVEAVAHEQGGQDVARFAGVIYAPNNKNDRNHDRRLTSENKARVRQVRNHAPGSIIPRGVDPLQVTAQEVTDFYQGLRLQYGEDNRRLVQEVARQEIPASHQYLR